MLAAMQTYPLQDKMLKFFKSNEPDPRKAKTLKTCMSDRSALEMAAGLPEYTSFQTQTQQMLRGLVEL